MAKSVVRSKDQFKSDLIKTSNYPLLTIKKVNDLSVVRPKTQFKTKSINTSKYPVGTIKNVNGPNTKIENVLPFKVKFINIGIPGYGPNNVPPIGIQVIEFNNFIL